MELDHLIILSAIVIILSFIAYIIISLRVVLNKKTTARKQIILTNILLLIGISGIFCAVLSHFNNSIDYFTHSIFLIVSSGVLTYAFMEKIYINRIKKELNFKVSEHDK